MIKSKIKTNTKAKQKGIRININTSSKYKRNPDIYDLESDIYSIEKLADDLRSWNINNVPFPDVDKIIKQKWHQHYGADIIKLYLSEIMSQRSKSYWGIQTYGVNKDLEDANLRWRGVKADLRGELGYSEKTSDNHKHWLDSESSIKRQNPPKGEFSKNFKDKWTEYYEEAMDKYNDKSRAAKLAWFRIKRTYENSDKSGKWILKKVKKLNKKSR